MDISDDKFVELLRGSFDEPAQKTLPAEIGMDTELGSLEGWDSLTRLSLTVALEEEFEVAMEQEHFQECETVEELLAVVRSMG